MNGFIDYLVGNWEVNGCVGIEKRFGHMKKIKIDKKSDTEIVQHILAVGLKFFDKDNNLLKSESVKFVNNTLNANDKKKKLINISGDELENKFMFAKNDILNVINGEYRDKINEINLKLSDLMSYYDKDSVVTNKEFKGERVEINKRTKKDIAIDKKIVDDSNKNKNKKQFEM